VDYAGVPGCCSKRKVIGKLCLFARQGKHSELHAVGAVCRNNAPAPMGSENQRLYQLLFHRRGLLRCEKIQRCVFQQPGGGSATLSTVESSRSSNRACGSLNRSGLRYPSDLTDTEWAIVEPESHLPLLQDRRQDQPPPITFNVVTASGAA
jgi:hypothetical protein